jgi:hypothetical protein
MAIKSTRLRYISARKLNDLISYVNNLPFKIEIKGNPVLEGRLWVLFFILPEIEGIELGNIDL